MWLSTLVTTAESRHSPEIAYLRNGINGLIVQGGADRYAESIINLFNAPEKLAEIKDAALADAKRYTLENMVENFADGIARCVAMQD
jgi:L-malate glycosyltransferase